MTDAAREYREAGGFTLTSLPKGREWERWCEYTQPLSLPERGKADAALAEAYAVIERVNSQRVGEQKAKVRAEHRAEKAEADLARRAEEEADHD